MSKHLTLDNLSAALPPLKHLIDKKAEGVDWNENDPAASGYVKNRPFYTSQEKQCLQSPTDLTFELDGTGRYVTNLGIANFIADYSSCTVTWDGTEYECKIYVDNNAGAAYIGNAAEVWDATVGNNEPFCAFQFFGGNNPLFITTLDTSSTHEVSIYVTGEVVHKIDSKFLPDLGVGAKGDGENAEVFNGGSADQASGKYSHVEGIFNVATSPYTHAEGRENEASGLGSHVEGGYNAAKGYYSHAEGRSTTATNDSSDTVSDYITTAAGYATHAEGCSTVAYGAASHAEGLRTMASGMYAHSEGSETTASGDCSHAEGKETTASNTYAHAEGQNTTASGSSSHAEGCYTKAKDIGDHAEGWYAVAKGGESHAEGLWTIASKRSQHAQGKFNIEDTDTSTAWGKYAHIVGNGNDSDTRSNAHTLDWNGNAWFQGEVYVGGNDQDSGEKLAKQSEIPANSNIVNGSATGSLRTVGSDQESSSYVIGQNAFAEGLSTAASGSCSHAEGIGSHAAKTAQHVYGRHNIIDNYEQSVAGVTGYGKYVCIVGNGNTQYAPRNAHTLDWDGLGWFAGGLKVGGTGQDDEAAVEVALKTDLVAMTVDEIDAICGATIYDAEEVEL